VTHLPRTESHGRLLHVVDGHHVFCPASPAAPQPIAERPDLPAVGVTRESAATYAAWLGMEVGGPLRLPTEPEWEKAARGADGRDYPWGNSFDPTFCSMLTSTEERANLRSVAAFPVDVSPYGCADMAGGVREWCKDDAPEDAVSAVCRGGAWYLRARDCRTTMRWLVDPNSRNPGIGFRLAADISDDPTVSQLG
jgi:serine/threonine-protein kinase